MKRLRQHLNDPATRFFLRWFMLFTMLAAAAASAALRTMLAAAHEPFIYTGY